MLERFHGKRTLAVLSCAVLTIAQAAAQDFVVELSKGDQRIEVPAEEGFAVELHHLVPGFEYSLQVRREALPQNLPVSRSAVPGPSRGTSKCGELWSRMREVEDEIELRDALLEACSSATKRCQRATLRMREATQTKVPGGPFLLKEGQELLLVVTRTSGTGERRDWILVFRAQEETAS